MAKRKHPSRPSKRRSGRPNPKDAPRRGKHESAFTSADYGAVATAAGGASAKRPGRARRTNWIYGFHAVLAALANPERVCHRLLVNTTAAEDLKAAVAKARDSVSGRPQPASVERTEIEKALPPGAVHQGLALLTEPLPAVAIEDVIKASAHTDDATVVVLDQATDPRNVGAVMRSAAAFGAAAVIVQNRHAPPMTGALCKAASGAAEWVPMARAGNLARAIWTLKDAGFWCAGLDPAAERTLAQAGFSGRVALVLGAEGRGLRPLTRKTCDSLVRIPAAAGTESLNLSNAAAIALYELRRERA
ncbi:MAG: 23S rRNA (guanosine(2251)-2'-O)-methyltransferase RlmB [Proteobacteria bacterium]|nr:23S rRNA (guanosine(2251)-2'-O)-methyltransferase RlmB [Pseudomonadota bacterium]